MVKLTEDGLVLTVDSDDEEVSQKSLSIAGVGRGVLHLHLWQRILVWLDRWMMPPLG